MEGIPKADRVRSSYYTEYGYHILPARHEPAGFKVQDTREGDRNEAE
jgi:hypothetical protein